MGGGKSEAFSWNPAAREASNPVTETRTSRETQMDDLRCVAAVRRGEPGAFVEVVRRYEDRLFNTVLRLLGDYEEARDLTQQTFLRAYSSLERFRGDSSFYTWLYRIAVNVTLDERKKRSRAPETHGELPDDDSLAGHGARGVDDPAEHALTREREQAVAGAIASLDPLHRAVVVLRDIEGMDYDEIASVLDVPRGTVKSRLHRARLELRDKLKDLMS